MFPWIQSVSLDSGQADVDDGVGVRRCCNFGTGLVLEETIVGWNPPHLYAYACEDESNPFEIVRIIRSFDPCLACSIHLITPKGRDLGKFRVV